MKKFLLSVPALLLAVLFLAAAAPPPGPAPASLAELLSSSVTIMTPSGSGSGVLVKNRTSGICFVWTVGHVVVDQRVVEVALDPATFKPSAVVSYRDVLVLQARFHRGRKVGEDMRYARIIRLSVLEEGGEDLALLQLYDPEFGGKGVRFVRPGFIPQAGLGLWHIGSPRGRLAMGFVAGGTFSTAGRLMARGNSRDEAHEARAFDEAAIASLPGCSGGGVFLQRSGQCVGLLHGGPGEAVSFFVPSRRIWTFATRTRCLWALDGTKAVPACDSTPVSDRPIPIPAALSLLLAGPRVKPVVKP